MYKVCQMFADKTILSIHHVGVGQTLPSTPVNTLLGPFHIDKVDKAGGMASSPKLHVISKVTRNQDPHQQNIKTHHTQHQTRLKTIIQIT